MSDKSKQPAKQPVKRLIQHKQQCPWCREYLLLGQSIELYKGDDDSFALWLVHEECNKLYVSTIKYNTIDIN